MPIYHRTTHAKLISLTGHTFTYPPHSHVSVYTVGVLLRDAMELWQGHENHLVRAEEWFVVPPYTVRSLVPRNRWAEKAVAGRTRHGAGGKARGARLAGMRVRAETPLQ
jgi:hypothetical protein